MRHIARLLACTLLPVSLLVVLGQSPVWACDDPSASSDLMSASGSCVKTGSQAIADAESHNDALYTINPQCFDVNTGVTDSCTRPQACVGPPPGFLYLLLRNGKPDGLTCLSADQAAHFGEITPGYVAEQWQDLDWETAGLTLQPPDGQTLVNFPTNFFTTMSPQPQTLTVTLLGIPVTIEATPTAWTWHPGNPTDANDQWSTSDPGTPYSDGIDADSLNTFRYLHAGTVTPSVDVTYTGRFRVNGGAWQDIPGDLTKPGTTVNLDVLPAGAHLTGN